MERLLKTAGQTVPTSPPIMELNPGHPIVERLKRDEDEKRSSDWAHILFDQALLSEGGQPEDPATFVRRLNEMFLELTETGSPKAG